MFSPEITLTVDTRWWVWAEGNRTSYLCRPGDASATVVRPVIYVNTATHLLGCKNNNDVECTTIADYKLYSGNSKQATEILLKAAEAANPDKKEVSPLAQLIPVRTGNNFKDKKPKPA